ncbi:MAG: ABC transporter permease [Planctomycetes bacterium]|nr:ABC transporter permease [Planctomycetota bacterium]
MALPLSYNIRNVRARWRVTILAALGITLVVAVFVFLMAMAIGFRHALQATGSPENAIVVQSGSLSELTSGLSKSNADFIAADSRVQRDARGEPLASPEIVVIANLNRRADGRPTNVLIRGATPKAFEVRAGLKLKEGRWFTPGLQEVAVGERIQERIAGLDIGSTVNIKKRDWKIVGLFSSGGSGFESEIWGDAEVMAAAFNRQGSCQSLTVRLADPRTLEAFAEELKSDPKMQVQMKEERRYYEEQAGPIVRLLVTLAAFVATVMGIGAILGGMNTMYAMVAARTREIGTLRAIGFSRASILLSFVIESCFLALAGGLLGCFLALPAHGLTTATGNATFSELAFAFRITPAALASGLLLALGLGVLGGLLPALRAARLPIAAALREA